MTDILYRSFFNATTDVLKRMLDVDADGAKEKRTAPDGGVCVAVGVTGDLEGEIVYCFPDATALGMVRIMSGMDFDSVDEFVLSAVGEIANIISGKALIFLSEQRLTCDILPPRVLTDTCAYDRDGLAGSIVTDIGDIGFHLCLRAAHPGR